MTRRIVPTKKPQPIPAMICRTREEVTHAMQKVRECRGLSQNDLDAHAGFNVGYTGKMEQPFPRKWPSGRCTMHPLFDTWLAALGVALVVVADEHTAGGVRISQAVTPPPKPPTMTFKRAQRLRKLHAEGGWTVKLLAASFHTTPRMVRDVLEGRAYPIPEAANDQQP
jgi:ribosome-binding protein aMBF1 (putative translation factor)